MPKPCLLANAVALALAGITFAAPVMAKNNDENPPAESSAASLDKVVVTGSRIQSPNMDTPNPISSIDREAIGYSGKTNVQEVVNEVGALVGSDGDNEVSNGESALNLRNLGSNRTLVLVDGHRFVSGFSGTSAVDVNVIPTALIERVDVLTGGASAIYGADAVTGVVNFVLKRNFEGLAIEGQYGDAQRGDFRDQQYAITFGRNFAEGRGNVTASYTFGSRPLTLATARKQSSTDVHEQVNNLNGPNPRYVLMSGTREAFFTEGGARFDPFNPTGGFNGDGTPFQHGVNVGSFGGTGEIGGDGIPNWLLFAQGIRPMARRNLLTLKADYEVSDAFHPYISLHYADIKNRSIEQHSLTVGSQAKRDNPYLPATVLEAFGGINGTAPIMFNRWDLDSGFRDDKIDKKSWRILTGAQGDLGQYLRYDLSLNHGRSERTHVVKNNRMYDRYLAAMDAVLDPATGQVTCRSNLDPSSFNSLPIDFISTSFVTALGPVTFTPGPGSGCVPFNPFTRDNSVNQEAIAWIWVPTESRLVNKQTVVNGYLAGDTGGFFNLQGGPIDVVLGGEYRKEQSDYGFDEFSGSSRLVAFNNGSDLSGEFSVREAFVEVSLPLFRDLHPAVKMLKLDAAGRYSDYSTIGVTQTWKYGAMWETLAGVTMRGTWSSAVRAPNIGELFEPRRAISASMGGARDPCAPANWDLGTEYRRANCFADLAALGIDPASFNPMLGTYFPGISGGNPNLEEETARTRTYGVLWQVPWVSNLVVSLDYFDIRMKGAVLRPTQMSLFNACYDSPTLDNPFCRLIGRDPATGFANFVELSYINVAAIRTSGFEFSLHHSLETTRAGTFRTSLNATRTHRLDVQKSLLPVVTDELGIFNTDLGGSSPEWVVNFDLGWQYGRWDANYGFNFSSSTLRPPLINAQRAMANEYIDRPFVKSFRNHDIQVGFRPKDDTRLYFGVRNLADEYPDPVRGSLNGSSGRQGFAGRSWYMGFQMNFGAN
ncbi:hypothetical protein CO608_02050 [Lysobacteraceae bacterium NML08-0793]|nr:hypothetical protein CO608_02050 [Xanthomonadaceae bacterium NML08-0793]